ncbi:uncharacterized protein [Euphorbia lathyris]|uniref:uncharacterized protein n=1 Tax=Euphorbia lathyris TaxID=212925 RepID=UPI003313AEED
MASATPSENSSGSSVDLPVLSRESLSSSLKGDNKSISSQRIQQMYEEISVIKERLNEANQHLDDLLNLVSVFEDEPPSPKQSQPPSQKQLPPPRRSSQKLPSPSIQSAFSAYQRGGSQPRLGGTRSQPRSGGTQSGGTRSRPQPWTY